MCTINALGLLIALQVTAHSDVSQVEAAISRFEKEIAQLEAEGVNVDSRMVQRLAEKHMNSVDFSTLTLDQAYRLNDSWLANPRTYGENMRQALKRFRPMNDEDKWKFALIQFCASMKDRQDTNIRPADVGSALEQVLKHPLVRQRISSADGTLLFRRLSKASDKRWIPKRQLFQLCSVVRNGIPFDHYNTLLDTYIRSSADLGVKDQDQAWKDLRASLEAGLIASRKSDPESALEMESYIRKLESNIGRGKFVGYPVPDIAFKWSSDPLITRLSNLRGKVVVLTFWATWCGPCLESFPQTRDLVNAYQGKPVVFLGVSAIEGRMVEDGKVVKFDNRPNDEIAAYPGYMKRKNITWSLALTENWDTMEDYACSYLSRTMIINAEGKGRRWGIDLWSHSLEETKAMIDPLISRIKKN